MIQLPRRKDAPLRNQALLSERIEFKGHWVSVVVCCALLALSACRAPHDGVEPQPDAGPTPAVTGPVQPASDTTITYRDRKVDLEPFLIGFPYSRFAPDLEHGQMLFFEERPEGRFLNHYVIDDQPISPERGRRLTDIDWSTRSYWGARYHPPSRRYFLTSDEANDEKTNVYALSVDTGALERVTDNDYTYGWGISEDHKLLAYLDRSGTVEPFVTTLKILDLETGQTRSVVSDADSDVRFTWAEPRFTPDNTSLILEVLHDGNRNTPNLARIDLSSSAPQVVTLLPDRIVRFGVSILDGWAAPGVLLYQSGESGVQDVYRLDLNAGSTQRLTDFRQHVASAVLLEADRPLLLVLLGGQVVTEFRLVDLADGNTLCQSSVPSNCMLSDHHGTEAIFRAADTRTSFRMGKIGIVRQGASWTFQFQSWIELPESLRQQMCTVSSERVEFPTFDRTLSGFYMEPLQPPKDPADRRVMIVSFYGGDNEYSRNDHILGAAGIATFSPRVRGAWGAGEEFAALNDRDLGGDEIVDLIYAARWLVEKKGYEPYQIGLRGGSHGGYATMRALTFPPGTNGRQEQFDFGYGWSHAGFSDIISFHAKCNIPDWVIKEAGDPVRERAKLVDRSPLTHVELLRAPILLTHGANDWRVPVTESQRFVERARQLDRPVTYLEFVGQGHGIQGFKNLVSYYRGVFEFLEDVGPSVAD